MSQGTKLFQQPGSPLIQGRSRTRRPWWQPYLIAVALGLMWPFASQVPHLAAESETAGLAEAVVTVFEAWVDGLLVLVPSVLVGAIAGVWIANAWGVRRRWLAGAAGAVGAWYAALVLLGLFG